MTKPVRITLAAVIVLFLGAVIAALFVTRPAESTWVDIIQDGKVIYTIDIANSEDRTIDIEYPGGGYNTVVISNGQISITDADCPDKTCVNTGVLRSESVPIVCLPHRLVIRYSDGGGNDK